MIRVSSTPVARVTLCVASAAFLVLLFKTARPNERALLIHTLLTLSPKLGQEARMAAVLAGWPQTWQATWRGRVLGE